MPCAPEITLSSAPERKTPRAAYLGRVRWAVWKREFLWLERGRSDREANRCGALPNGVGSWPPEGRRKGRWIAVLVAVVALASGCNALQFGYNHARWAVVPKLKKVADFNSAQRAQIDQEFARYMDWHRRAMLPEYAKLLRQLAATVSAEIPAGALQAQRAAWLDAWEATMQPALAPMADVLGGLDDGQLASMQANFADEDADGRDELRKKTREERLKKRDAQVLDLLDEWAGGLTKPQRAALQPWVRKMPWQDERWLDERKQMRDDLLARLRAHEATDRIVAAFRAWFVDRRRRLDADGGPAFDAFMHAAARTLDGVQRQHVREKLLGYAKDCEVLARQP